MIINISYVICTNPRSGSWLLSEGLASTMLAGNPREWFHHEEEQRQRAKWTTEVVQHAAPQTFLQYLLNCGTSRNGIFGIKLHYYQFIDLPNRLAIKETHEGQLPSALLPQLLPNVRYIWLTRRNRARQAISYYLATQSDEWWLIEGTTSKQRTDRNDHPPFDPNAIDRLERLLDLNDQRWLQFFAENDITPLTVYYEDLAADYTGKIVSVLNWLGVSDASNVNIPVPRLKRQSNTDTENWLERYLAVKASVQHHAVLSSADVASGQPPLHRSAIEGSEALKALSGNPLLESEVVLTPQQ